MLSVREGADVDLSPRELTDHDSDAEEQHQKQGHLVHQEQHLVHQPHRAAGAMASTFHDYYAASVGIRNDVIKSSPAGDLPQYQGTLI